MAMGRAKESTDAWIGTQEFDDAQSHRPEWAWDVSQSEYLAHLISIGWTPKSHVWNRADRSQ